MQRSLLLLSCFIVFGATHAQQVQKCCGTSNSTFLLGNTTYARHSQLLYLPGDLTGAANGPITHLYFRYGTTGIAAGNTLGNFMVRLGQTSATVFTNGDEYFTALDTVYTATSFQIAPGATGDWFWFSLQTPFMYATNQTLIVDITFETSTTANFGTYGTSNDGRKLVSPDLGSATGSSTSSTWQDMGFDIDGTLGQAGLEERNTLLWPNPATDRTTIFWAAGKPAPSHLMVLDGSGRVWRTLLVPQGGGPMDLDLHGLDAGIYMLRWHDANGSSGGAQLIVE